MFTSESSRNNWPAGRELYSFKINNGTQCTQYNDGALKLTLLYCVCLWMLVWDLDMNLAGRCQRSYLHCGSDYCAKVADSFLGCHQLPPELPCGRLSCLLSPWRWEVLTRAAHVQRGGGGELILDHRNGWLVVSEWHGTRPPSKGSIPHTLTHTRADLWDLISFFLAENFGRSWQTSGFKRCIIIIAA